MKVLSAIVILCGSAGSLLAQELRPAEGWVKTMQAAVDRRETKEEVLSLLTESCIADGQAEAAQQALLKLHDGITDPHAKLALLRPMKWAAFAAGKLPELEKLFAARRDAQPDSALAWLEQAEIEGASHSYPTQSGNLTKAGTLALENEALLREVLDRQEEAGFWDDGLSTAENWVKKHSTPQAMCRLANLHLIVGDDLRAWKLAAEAVKDARLTAGDLQELSRDYRQ